MKFGKQTTVIIICIGLLCLLWVLFSGVGKTRPAPVQAADVYQSGYPGPATPTPNSIPDYPPPVGEVPAPTDDPGMLHVTTMLTLVSQQDVPSPPLVPEVNLISPSPEEIPNLHLEAFTLEYDGPLPTSTSPLLATQPDADLVDNWELLLAEDFEGTFPQQPDCVVFDDSPDGKERYWDKDDHRPLYGQRAGWPAKGGADGVDPSHTAYPSNLDTWIVCGPYDLSQADNIMADFALWLDIGDEADGFLIGASNNGTFFRMQKLWGVSENWFRLHAYFPWLEGQDEAYIAVAFESDDDFFNFDEGAWIDDFQIWRYNTPDAVCGNLDPGNKGLVLPSLDPTTGGLSLMIRPGDTLAVDAMKNAGVDWVRLGFVQQNGSIDVRGFDRMIDTLCAEGLSVLGLINHESLSTTGYNDPATAEAYREAFGNIADFLALHYRGRITYWEVWNEPNFLQGAFVDPIRFAPLLQEAYDEIKGRNSQAQILFGGLASAWGDSDQYFEQVYTYFSGSSPFSYFAVHPYPKADYGPNPGIYMYAELPLGHDTIIDKFLETMYLESDGNKHVWITEAGWNSAKNLPNRPVCHDPVLVTETEQSNYLKPMFDILFTEVDLWQIPGVSAVDKVIWYQYMDVGVPDPCTGGQTNNSHAYIPVQEMTTSEQDVVWLFGLYRSDKTSTKPVWCEYLAYPFSCDEFFDNQIFLPAVRKPN